MSFKLDYKMAGKQAEQLLNKLGKINLPINPFLIAEEHDILVEPKEFDTPTVFGC